MARRGGGQNEGHGEQRDRGAMKCYLLSVSYETCRYLIPPSPDTPLGANGFDVKPLPSQAEQLFVNGINSAWFHHAELERFTFFLAPALSTKMSWADASMKCSCCVFQRVASIDLVARFFETIERATFNCSRCQREET